ncbi:MAG: energy-coupling factor transporter ATPase [Firmicutes bacterium]|nr:energy-coupling factor transporter ATPase [Bacillota bacterium]
MPILINNLSHIYNQDSPLEVRALDGISLEIRDGEFLGLIGATGSGKSTLIQHLDGLLRPTSGHVLVDDVAITATSKGSLKAVRQKVGLVFQYPEHQLFEETVGKDVGFGPRNLGLGPSEVEERVLAALHRVGLPEEVLDRSPFELSGGQIRRVAIAGVLAMQPKVLILDEPTAGLDPRGREEILGQIQRLHADYGLTVVLVSHSMEDVARVAQRLVVLHRGRVALQGTPREVFAHAAELAAMGLGVPQVTSLMQALRDRGLSVRADVLTVEEAREELAACLRNRAGTLPPAAASGERGAARA